MSYSILQDLATPYSATVRYVLPSVAALVVHAAVQMREPYGHQVVGAHIVATIFITLAIYFAWGVGILASFATTVEMITHFWLVISASIMTYRTFFHPLCSFPGPRWHHLSMWTWTPIDVKGTRHHYIPNYHKKHGTVVRIGPNQLSIDDPAALPLIHKMNNTVKGPWYRAFNVRPGIYSLLTEPTTASHAARRRIWDPAFTPKAVRGYSDLVLSTCDDLVANIEDKIKSPEIKGRIDVRETVLFYTFDTISKIGFGRSFGLLRSSKNRFIMNQILRVPFVNNILGDTPYLSPLLRYIKDPLAGFRQWVMEAVQMRIKRFDDENFNHTDVFAYFLGQATTAQQRKQFSREMLDLFRDAQLLIVAGSDTSANSITNVLYELSNRPELYKQVQKELDTICPNGINGEEDLEKLREGINLLQACIYEALRLWPVVPSGLQRMTVKPMILPNGQVIPIGTAVSVNIYTIQRDARNFYRPTEFLPERWLDPITNRVFNVDAQKPSELEEVTTKYSPHNFGAFHPFSLGPYACVGKTVAWAELRAVLATIMLRYDVEMKQEDYDSFGQSYEDHFVSSNGPCWMTIKPRDKSA
ncbi:unnamed protein product [Sympodiomycopsis kandeliae]